MTGADLFDFYRELLAIVVGTYGAVRLVRFLWRWQLSGRAASRGELLARRYVVVQILRLRVSRFLLDLIEIVVLLGLLGWLICLHGRW